MPSQQAVVLSEARVILEAEGSGRTNSLIMPEGAEGVTLRSPHNHSMIQRGLYQARQQSEQVVFGSIGAEKKAIRNANFSVGSALLRKLQVILGS